MGYSFERGSDPVLTINAARKLPGLLETVATGQVIVGSNYFSRELSKRRATYLKQTIDHRLTAVSADPSSPDIGAADQGVALPVSSRKFLRQVIDARIVFETTTRSGNYYDQCHPNHLQQAVTELQELEADLAA